MNTYKEKVKERFDELADSYTNNAVSYIRNKRLNLINKHIKKEDKVLEIGCGSGNILKLINSKNKEEILLSTVYILGTKKVFIIINKIYRLIEKVYILEKCFYT
jgi:ubiquinone/menaquinone biosynthesis C-methylase UbiE